MQIKQIIGALGAATLLSVAQAEETAVTVNGNAVSKAYLEAYAEAMTRQGHTGSPEQILEQLIIQQLLVDAALDSNLDEREDITMAMELQRRNLLAGSALQAYLDANTPDEDALREMYTDQVANQSQKEYKARHILLESEADAQAVIASLDEGGDFVELAKEKSTGPSGPRGGDLGWFAPEAMVPPFSQAVQSMSKGEYSKTPVQTQFGWHVILLEDERDLESETYESMEPKLREQAQRQLVNEYVAGLRENAEVVMP